MSRCPLCNTKLVDDNCPVCSDLSGPAGADGAAVPFAERTLRDRRSVRAEPPRPLSPKAAPEDEKAAWYAAAGMKMPEPLIPERTEEGEPLPELSRADHDQGNSAAATILIVNGIASILFMLTGRVGLGSVFGVANIVVAFTAAGFLLKGSGGVRFLVWAFAALTVAQSVAVIVIAGTWIDVIGALPGFALVAVLISEPGTKRVAATLLGCAAPFILLGLSMLAPSRAEKVLEEFVVADGRFDDAADGYSLKVPEGVVLIDKKKLIETIGKRGLLGGLMKDEVAKRSSRDRLEFVDKDGTISGGLVINRLPTHVTTDAMLPSLGLLGARSTRTEKVVPDAIQMLRDMEIQGWQSQEPGGTRDLIVARGKDGRLMVAHCLWASAGGERICREVFLGLSITP